MSIFICVFILNYVHQCSIYRYRFEHYEIWGCGDILRYTALLDRICTDYNKSSKSFI